MPYARGAQNQSEKTERLEARISPKLKARFKRAAELQGLSFTEYIVSAISEVSDRVIERDELIRLSRRDQKLFVKSLLSPPEPNKALREGAQWYLKKSQAR